MITVKNHGPLITATNYWDSELALAGKLFVSPNAGAIRVLLPPALYPVLEDMRTAKECVYSVAERGQTEILFDDGSDSPFALHLSAESYAMLPGKTEAGREWIVSVWTAKDGKPHKALERPCHWRRVDRIPCLKPWSAK